MAQGQEVAISSYLPTQQDWTCSKIYQTLPFYVTQHAFSIILLQSLPYGASCPPKIWMAPVVLAFRKVWTWFFLALGQDVASTVNMWYVTQSCCYMGLHLIFMRYGCLILLNDQGSGQPYNVNIEKLEFLNCSFLCILQYFFSFCNLQI